MIMSEPPELGIEWDLIVIGTGMGGAPLGHALARAGWRVLFCEQGRASGALRGRYPETAFERAEAPQPSHAALLQQAGRYAGLIEDRGGARTQRFVPFVGAGGGGSSALYGMALERFFPSDFEPRQHHADDPGTLPEAWPISYATLTPYYEAAERLFRVRGQADPLRAEARPHWLAPPPLTPPAAALSDTLRQRGLHPYRLPLACEFVADCACCQGYLCERACKNDAGRICLAPAVSEHGAHLLDECEVLKLEADRKRVTGVLCRWRGATHRLRGKRVVLAAGALESPRLLLASASADWPQGLANDSGLVGKNLMRHLIDLYLLAPETRSGFDNRQKEIAFNDFYQVDGQKLGSVQSFGRLPPASVMVAAMRDDIRQGGQPWLGPLFGLARPLVAGVLAKLVEQRLALASTLEDVPRAENRVALAPASAGTGGAAGSAAGAPRLVLHYRLKPADRQRILAFRELMQGVLRPQRYSLVKQAENNQRIAHVCGTCRFGLDPKDSVLDANNRAHALSNLYVVDASFFPSSGGTNPGLTIAANALRVADKLMEEGRP
jgi:choline dehydrogenase-like flavoprotein